MNKNIKEMGDGFYIVTEEGSNGMGGFCCHNVELRKHDDPSFCAEILRNQQFVNFPGLAHGKWEKISRWSMSLKKTDSLVLSIHLLMIEPYSVGQYSLTEDTGRMKVAMG